MRAHRGPLALLAGLLVMAAGCAATPDPGTPAPAYPPGVAALEGPRALMERAVDEPRPATAPSLPPDVPAPSPAEDRVARAAPAPEVEAAPLPPPPDPLPPPPETTAFIARDRVNLRPCAEETPRCPPIASLRLREEVRVTEDAEAWLLVHVPRLGRDGYIARRFVSATRPPADAVLAAPAAAPARDARGPRQATGARPSAPSAPPPEEELLQ
ncbi:MAG: hypothetical protein ACE147_19365 [Candidatus Methylomirabilales bacterium]